MKLDMQLGEGSYQRCMLLHIWKALLISLLLLSSLYLLVENLSAVICFFSVPFFFLLSAWAQALERQKDYFDCIKNERDELREELADLKETMKRGQVCW